MLPLGLYIMGEAPAELIEPCGDYADWFQALAEASGASLLLRDGRRGETIDSRDVAAIVITGSAASLVTPEPWMDQGLELLEQAQRVGTPTLGVCFGHQLIGAYAGASVIANPEGWEFATQSIDVLAPEDPLFRGVPPRFDANQAHQDIIDPLTLPAQASILAGNAKTRIQALAMGDSRRGVQFHPEFSGEVTRRYVDVRWSLLAEDADARSAPEDHPSALAAEDCSEATRVFGNFVRYFAHKA